MAKNILYQNEIATVGIWIQNHKNDDNFNQLIHMLEMIRKKEKDIDVVIYWLQLQLCSLNYEKESKDKNFILGLLLWSGCDSFER